MEQGITKSREQEMFAMLSGYEGSTMKVKEICALYGLAQGSYYYWLKKYKASRGAGDDTGDKSVFTLLKVEPDFSSQPPGPGALFAEYKEVKFYQVVSAIFLKELIG